MMRVHAPQIRLRNGLDDTAALVRRLQSGDERAYQQIFRSHQAPLLSYCRHMLFPGRSRGRSTANLHQSPRGPARRDRAARAAPVAVRDRAQLLPVGDRRAAAHGAVGGDRGPSPHALAGGGPLGGGLPPRGSARVVAGIGRLPEDQRSALLLADTTCPTRRSRRSWGAM